MAAQLGILIISLYNLSYQIRISGVDERENMVCKFNFGIYMNLFMTSLYDYF